MRIVVATFIVTTVLGSGGLSASPVGDTAPRQFAQLNEERRDVRREQRELRDAQGDLRDARGDLKDAQRDLRQADTPRERQRARDDLRDARGEVREERRDVRQERRDVQEERRELRDARLELQPEVRTRVHRYVTTNRTRVVQVPSGFTVTTGAVLPGNIVLQSFPADVGLAQYQYVIIGQQPVIVEPRTRRIVEIIR